jgi:outer membrane protein assembly factor BamA
MLTLGLTLVNAQTVYTLKLLPCQHARPDEINTLAGLKYKSAFTDSLQRLRQLNSILKQFYASGFLAASIEQINSEGSQWQVSLCTGNRYQWGQLRRGNVSESILNMAGVKEKFYSARVFRPEEVSRLMERLLNWCDRSGYPFAMAGLRDVTLHANHISASLWLQTGQRFTIDSILIKGDARVSTAYLQSYLGLKPRSVYNEQVIGRISSRIKELPMVSEVRPFAVEFHDSTATFYLYLQHRKASRLDGIIGVLPDERQAGRIQVTGQASIQLLSAFGHGELIDFTWKLPQPKTQHLKSRFNYPFLFQTPLGIDLGLTIYKKDSTYVDVNRMLGFQFSMSGGNFIKAFYELKKSTLLNVKNYELATELPPFADISSRHYGLAVRSLKLDYRLNPRRGYQMMFTSSAGKKTIHPNPKLKKIDYSRLKLPSVQYRLQIDMDVFFPLGNRFVNNTGLLGGLLASQETFQNELFRIGGLTTLRGFDEEAILASHFVILKNEWRYLIEENSYLQVFVNAAWYERRQRNYFLSDWPWGLGAGMTFETRLGIFSLNYALGREFNNPFRFRTAKVHFGLVNYF